MTDWDDEDIRDQERGSDTMACPSCGADIYDDSERCPFCGDYVVMRAGATSSRLWWRVALVLALAAIALFVVVQ